MSSQKESSRQRMKAKIQKELEVWNKYGPKQLSAHRLLATRDCVHEYAFSRKQHVLWFLDNSRTFQSWCCHVVRTWSEQLKHEQCLIHQAQIAISLFDGGVRSVELMQSIFDHDEMVSFVIRMRQAVHGGA